MTHKKLIVIGGGPAGLAAALSAAESGLSPADICILERDSEPGGILNQCIHAGFGLHRFDEELTGPEYAQRYIEMGKAAGLTVTVNAMVLSMTPDRQVTFVSPETGYVTWSADAVILAMGCRERTRGALGIPGTRPAGIYTAGTAQRYVNVEGYMPGKTVVILGSGDIGLIMARRMTLEGAKVLCVCELMPYSGGLARNIVQCLEDFDIPLYLSHTVTHIRGKNRVEGVTIAKVDNNRKPIPGTEISYDCDTLLLSVGLIPENELTRGAGIPIDRITSGAYVNQYRQTETAGIYACGNVLHVHDLVDYVSDEAAIAGKAAAAQILGQTAPTHHSVRVQPGDGIRYTVPQRLDLPDSPKEDIRLFFRVTDIYKKCRFTITDDAGRVLMQKIKSAAAPGEMESLTLSAKVLQGLSTEKSPYITVALEPMGGTV